MMDQRRSTGGTHRVVAWLTAGWWLCAGQAVAEDGMTAPLAATGSAEQQALPVMAARDPFATTELMQTEAQRQGAGPQFFPSQTAEAVPLLRLRGFIEDDQQSMIALLEVQGFGTYLVRAGDTISLQFRGHNTVLKVQTITNLSVLVEVGTLGQVIVVR